MRLNETLYNIDFKFLERILYAMNLATFVSWYLIYIVNPVIGITGLTGNIIGLFVITKCGLHRTSNILLFCLTLGDILCLIGTVNLPLLTSSTSDNAQVTWTLPYLHARIVAALYMLTLVVSKTGYAVSIQISIWMMVERLLAVFFPLTFRNLVTPARVWFLGLFVLCASSAFNIYSLKTQYTFLYGQRLSNVSGGMYMVSLVGANAYIISHGSYVFLYWLPVVVVILACIVISVRLVTVREVSDKLTSFTRKQPSSSRVRATFSIICLKVCLSQIILIPRYVVMHVTADFYHSTLGFVFITVFVFDSFVFVNSACDCIIFVALNKQFRSLFLKYFIVRCSSCKQ